MNSYYSDKYRKKIAENKLRKEQIFARLYEHLPSNQKPKAEFDSKQSNEPPSKLETALKMLSDLAIK